MVSLPLILDLALMAQQDNPIDIYKLDKVLLTFVISSRRGYYAHWLSCISAMNKSYYYIHVTEM
jgi:hypothetical protein